MPKHVERSWFVLNEAIGPYRQALADELGCSIDSIERMCTPPPGFTPETASNRGTRNWLDDLVTLARRCPDGLDAIRWLNRQVGLRVVPEHAPAEPGQLPIADATLVVAAAEKLAVELRRRKPKLTEADLLDLRDSLTDSLHALVARALERRRKARSNRE